MASTMQLPAPVLIPPLKVRRAATACSSPRRCRRRCAVAADRRGDADLRAFPPPQPRRPPLGAHSAPALPALPLTPAAAPRPPRPPLHPPPPPLSAPQEVCVQSVAAIFDQIPQLPGLDPKTVKKIIDILPVDLPLELAGTVRARARAR